jgi:hypothetical protein
MRSTAENLALWDQRIKERIQSGMTITDWCNKNGISKDKYNYWNKCISVKRKAGEEIAFADVSSILSMSGKARKISESTSDYQVFFRDMQVTVPETFNPASLAGLMKVLQKL